MLRQGWRLENREHQVEVWDGNYLFTSYKFYPDQFRPWFYPVNGPLGPSVTDEITDYTVTYGDQGLKGPGKLSGTESRTRYLPHIRSLSLGHGNVNGVDCWHENPRDKPPGRIHHVGVLRKEVNADHALLSVSSVWRRLPGDEYTLESRLDYDLMRDTRTFRFFSREGNRFIDVDTIFEPSSEDVVLGQDLHSALLYARLTRSMIVTNGGRIECAMGVGTQVDTMGKESPWCDYSGPVAGPESPWQGIAIMEHPGNPWQSRVWARDYGYFALSPFNWASHTIHFGTTLRVRYRVVVHDGDSHTADIAGEWERYEKEAT